MRGSNGNMRTVYGDDAESRSVPPQSRKTFLKLAAGPEGGGNDPISISTPAKRKMMSGPVFRKPRPRSQPGHSLPFHLGRTAEITLPVLIRVRRGRG